MSIYQHFRPEEREFVTKIQEWRDDAENMYSPKLTDFLDPREQKIVQSIIGRRTSVNAEFFGGTENCERARALIYPDYFNPVHDDFQISLWEIEYPRKFITLEHRQVLGSLMSIGLRREKFGDILLEGGRVQFFAAKEVSAYINQTLAAIGRTSISLKELPLTDAIQVKENWLELQTTVSSLRLDAILAAVYNMSRQKVQNIIKHGVVKVNWKIVENPAFECGEGDILSVRGHGRAKVIALEGKTKKDKWRIIAGKQQ